MVDIQSATADIRRGKKKKKIEEEETTGQKYNGHKNTFKYKISRHCSS